MKRMNRQGTMTSVILSQGLSLFSVLILLVTTFSPIFAPVYAAGAQRTTSTGHSFSQALPAWWNPSRSAIREANHLLPAWSPPRQPLANPGTVDNLQIEDAAVSGVEIVTHTLTADDSFTFYARGYDGTIDEGLQVVTWTMTLSPAVGTLSFTWNESTTLEAHTVGSAILTATLVATPTISTTALITVTPGVAVRLDLSPADRTTTAGQSETYSATAYDQDDNLVDDVTASTAFSIDAAAGGGWTDNVYTSEVAGSWPVTGSYTNTLDQLVTGTASLTVTAGALAVITVTPDAAQVTAGATQTFNATGADAYGNPVNVSATWTASVGDITAGPSATTVYTAPTVAPAMGSVTATEGSIVGTAAVEIQTGPLATVTVTPDPVTITVGETQVFTATGTDAYGNRVPVTPTWSSDVGTIGTSSDGLTATVVLDAYTNPAPVTGGITAAQNGVQDTAVINLEAGPLTTLTVSPGSATVIVADTQEFTASGTDQYGNSVPVSPQWTTNGGTVEPGPDATTLFTAQQTVASGQIVTATQDSVVGVASVDIIHGPVNFFYIIPSEISTQTAGQNFALTLEAKDVYHNLATRYNGVANLFDSTGSISPGSVTFSNGVWNGDVSVTVASENVVITVTDGTTTGHSNNFTVLPDVLDHFALSGYPSSIVAGESFPAAVQVTAYDQYDNVKTNYTGTVAFSSTDVSATLPAPYNFTSGDAGVHSFSGSSFALFHTPDQTLTIQDQDTSIQETSNTIAVTPAALGAFTLQGLPASTVAGTAFPSPVTVRAFDLYGNLKTNYQGTIHFSSSDWLYDLPENETFTVGDAGVHTFPGSEFALYHTTEQTVVVQDMSAGVSQSELVPVQPNVLDSFTIDAVGNPQTAGAAFDITINAFDFWDNPKTDYTGQPDLSDTTGTLTPDQTQGCDWSTGPGSCTQSVTITRAQSDVQITVADGSISAQSNAFDVQPGPLAQIAINSVSGNGGASVGYPVEVGAHVMSIYDTYTVWAGGYDAYDNYRNDVVVDWGVTGSVLMAGEIEPSNGISATFTPAPVLSGTGTIVATYAPGIEDFTGVFTITAPLLEIRKSDNPDPVPAGSSLGYTLIYTNVGNAVARNVRITETYDSNLTFENAGPPPINPDEGDNIWTRPTLGIGESDTIYVFMKVNGSLVPGTLLTNEVTIGGSRLAQNSFTENTTVTSTPDVTLTLTALPDPVDAGNNLVYRIHYANQGNAPVFNVYITMTYDDDVTFISSSETPMTGRNNVWYISTLPGKDADEGENEGTIDITARVDDFMLDQDSLIGRAEIVSDETARFEDSTVTTVQAPVLALTKSAAPSPARAFDHLTYSLVYSNVGSIASSALIITDAVPQNTRFVSCQPTPCSESGGMVTWQPGTLAAGDSDVATLVVDVDRNLDSGTILTNHAGVRVFATPQYSASARITTTVVSTPSIWLNMSNGRDAVQAGEELVYTLSYGNDGSGKGYDTLIVATLPDPQLVNYKDCSPSAQCIRSGSLVTYQLGTVNGGSASAVYLTVQVTDPLTAGLHVVEAAAGIETSTPEDPAGDNKAQDQDPVSTRPDLLLTVDYESIKPYPGKLVTYTIHYSNEGHIATTGVTVVFTRPEYAIYNLAATQAAGALGWVSQGERRYVHAVGDMDYGQQGVLTFVVTLTDTHFTAAGIDNFDASFEVYDSGVSGADANPTDNAILAPMGVPNLVIEDVQIDFSIWSGQPGYLTVTVRNTGSGTACGVYRDDCAFFGLDPFINPRMPPQSYPNERFGTCFVYFDPIAPGAAETKVISFTLDPVLGNGGYDGYCPAILVEDKIERNVERIWLKVDNWDPNSAVPEGIDTFGWVPESDESDNLVGPLALPQRLYLPLVLRNR